MPDEGGDGSGEGVHDALSDEAELNEAVVGIDLSADGIAIGLGLHVKVLIAGVATDGGHVTHPEVVEERADDAERALEGDFNLEAVTVEANDV